MQRYPAYQDSGLEWLGEVPAHWETTKAKWLFANISEKNCPDEQLLSATQEFGVVPRDMLEDRVVMPMGELGQFKLVLEGDFVISLRSFQGGIEYSEYKGLVSPAYTVLRNKKPIDKSYFKYLMKCFPFISELQTSITGIREGKNINYKDFAEIIIPIPPISEQTKIASFIEEQTAVINQFLTNKRRLIELLEEQKQVVINTAVTQGLDTTVPRKPSGIKWLEEIPLNWKVKQIRYLATKIGSGVTPRGGAQVYQDSGIPLLRSQNVHFDGLRLDDVAFISNEINNEMSNSKVQPNDVLLNITGASIGRCTYVSAMLTEANVNQHVCIIRTDQSELFAPYLASYLSSNHIQTFIDVSQEGAAREGLPQKEIKTIPIAYPPVDEQKQIVKFINEKTAEINTAIERTQREIELIEEYRTTLIAHAVTGKIDVRTHLENARKNVNI